MRYALVSLRNDTAEKISRYLPGNYSIAGYVPHDPNALNSPRAYGPCVLVQGEDNAGWTMSEYVLPRLASGLIAASEITEEEALAYGLEPEYVHVLSALVDRVELTELEVRAVEAAVAAMRTMSNGHRSSSHEIRQSLEAIWEVLPEDPNRALGVFDLLADIDRFNAGEYS